MESNIIVIIHKHSRLCYTYQWWIQTFWKKGGGGRQFISSVLIYRKCAQRNICLLHGKSGFLEKYEPIGGGRPQRPPLWIRHCYLHHVTNVEVLRLTCQTQLSTTLRDRRLRFLVISRGPTAEWIIHVLSDPLFLDCHAIGNDLLVDHDRTWLRTIQQDLRPLNIGLVSAWQRAQDRERWKRTVEMAMLQDGACSWWWWSTNIAVCSLVYSRDAFSYKPVPFSRYKTLRKQLDS